MKKHFLVRLLLLPVRIIVVVTITLLATLAHTINPSWDEKIHAFLKKHSKHNKEENNG